MSGARTRTQLRIRPLLALCAQRTAARTERGASPQRREPPAPPCPPPTATHEQQRHESQSFKMPRAQGQGARAWVITNMDSALFRYP